MIAVKPGEQGEWISLGQEGIDHDGDGQILIAFYLVP